MSEYERQYRDGSDPRVLDIIDVPVRGPRPSSYQTENWLLDPEYYWEKVGQLSSAGLAALTDPVSPLWINGHKTHNGLNDKIPIAVAGSVTDSLRLLHVDRLRFSVFTPNAAFGNNKRRVQGRFRYANHQYWLWVTDPRVERAYLAKPDGEYDVGAHYLTVSLGEPFNDAYYKLIAAIMPVG